MSKLFRYGGLVASIVLIAFGIRAIYTGLNGRDRVRSDLAREQISGTPDSSIPGQLVDSGSEAQAFATVMRKHTLEATGGQTYAQMPRYLDAAGKATNDEKAAAKDPKTSEPVPTGPQPLGQRDRALDGAQHGLLRRERRHLRDRHGHRPAAQRHRLPDPYAAGAPGTRPRDRALQAGRRPASGGQRLSS